MCVAWSFWCLCRLWFVGCVCLDSLFMNSSSGPHSSPPGKASYLRCFSCSWSQLLWKSSFIRLNQSVLNPPWFYQHKTPWSRSFFRHELGNRNGFSARMLVFIACFYPLFLKYRISFVKWNNVTSIPRSIS